MPRILLHDASILMDLLSVDLLGITLDLPFEMETTDLIIAELTDPDQRNEANRQVAAGKLTVVHSSGEDLAVLSLMKSRHSNLSLPDCSVLHWAREHDAIVLSGDAIIRKVAVDQGLEVHGTIWVLERLIQQTLLRPSAAAECLELLMSVNTRLPRKECEMHIRRWKSVLH